MNDINKNPTNPELQNDRSVKKSLLARASLFLLFAVGIICLTLGTIKYLNRSVDDSVLDRLPEIPPGAAKYELLIQALTKADRDLRQTLLSNQPRRSFGQKAGHLGELYHGNDFYPEALACYEIAMEFDPQNPFWPHHSAMLKQTRGETGSVVDLLKRTIELAEGYLPAVLKLADIYYKMGEFDQAAIYYQKSLVLNPGDKFALLGLSRIALDSSKWQQGQLYLEKIIESDPAFGAAHRLLASVHKHFGRTELMTRALEKAEEGWKKSRNPTAPDPWSEEVDLLSYDARKILTLGYKARQMNYFRLARRFFQRSLVLDCDISEPYMVNGMGLVEAKLYKEAQPFFEKVIQIDPDNDRAYRQRGIYLINEFEAQKAEEKLLKALQIDPENSRTNYFLGMCAFLQADFQKAIKLFTRAFEIDPALDADDPGLSMGRELILNPNDPQHYIATGNKIFALGQGHREVSKKFFEKIIQLDHGNFEAYDKLGMILMSEQKTQQAEQMFLKALESDSENSGARLHLAQILLEKNQIQSALEQYRLLLQGDPDSVKVLNSLAWILATTEDTKSRDPAEAIKLAKRACELTNYKGLKITDTLAAAYAADGQFQKATETAQKALALARSSGKEALAIKIQERLELYKAHQPYRQSQPE
jgi:tetratricopeptide (TPR) repeat protein